MAKDVQIFIRWMDGLFNRFLAVAGVRHCPVAQIVRELLHSMWSVRKSRRQISIASIF